MLRGGERQDLWVGEFFKKIWPQLRWKGFMAGSDLVVRVYLVGNRNITIPAPHRMNGQTGGSDHY